MNQLATKKAVAHFSLLRFFFTIGLSLAGFLLVLALVAPSVWRVQLTAGILPFVWVFLAVHLLNAFVEYFFHRYVLHSPLIPLLGRFYRQHKLHHGLTLVTKHAVQGEEVLRIENRYPIVQERQHEASFFPWYTFAVFGLLATPLFLAAQWLLVSAPIFLAGYAALAWSLSLYEILHAVAHWPQEKWSSLLAHPRWGRFWRKVYAFHLRHHADVRSNETISGFLGLPVADWIFGTYVGTVVLYEHETVVEGDLFSSPPARFIRWLDKLADKRIHGKLAPQLNRLPTK